MRQDLSTYDSKVGHKFNVSEKCTDLLGFTIDQHLKYDQMGSRRLPELEDLVVDVAETLGGISILDVEIQTKNRR